MRNLIVGSYLNAWSGFAPTVLRVVTGIIFALHGWQKVEGGLPMVAGMLEGMGFPMPMVFAVLLIAAELGGGILLILGVLTRLSAKILAIVSLVALVVVHLPNGFFMSTGGYEYILLLLAASVSIALSGPGRWALGRGLWK
ncbi:MAG TPA: DoxX family protein [Candidatus Paceibacterota bacterium]|nr:DoxX family protein [Candidatus Paceibacterota bacterium]